MYVASLWSTGNASDTAVSSLLQLHVEPLLVRHQVDLVLTGHHHSYQRTCPVRGNKCVGPGGVAALRRAALHHALDHVEFQRLAEAVRPPPGAPIHLVLGHGGAGYSTLIPDPLPGVFEVVALRHGYLRIEADRSALSVESVEADTGAIIDSFRVFK